MADQEHVAEALSKREQEVADAYAEGQSYKEIARDLGLSPTTVRSHLRTVYSKLGVTSKIELAQFLNDASVPDQGRDTTGLVADLALELDDAVRRERGLAQILQIISKQDDQLEPVIDAVLNHALEICEAEFGVLFEFQGEMRARELQSRNVAPAFEAWLKEQGAFELDPATAIGRMATTQQTVNIADVRGEEVYQSGSPLRIATADLGKARSFAAIPMMSGGRLIGAFTVYRTRVHPFNDRALELAQVFADQAAIAIENVRKIQELQSRLAREEGTGEILHLISQSLGDEAPVFDLILKNAAELCGADAAALTLGKEGEPHQRLAASRGVAPETEAHYDAGRVSMSPSSFAAKAILSGEPVYVEDFAETAGYQDGDVAMRSLVDDSGMRTSLFVPLLSKAGGVGALILFRKEVRAYSADEISLVQNFATQAVIAIENVGQFRELQVRLERAAATREILQVISQSRDDDAPVFEAIVSNVGKLCGNANVALHIADQTRTHASYVAGWGDPTKNFETGISNWPLAEPLPLTDAIREAQIINIPDTAADDPYKDRHPDRAKFLERDRIRSQLVVPLLANGKGIGCFEIYRREVKPFSDGEIALVEAFAAQAVIAIENVRQFRELEARLERAAATRQVLEAISGSRDDEAPVFDVILENACRLCETPMGAIVLGREGDEIQHMVAQRGVSEAAQELYRTGQYTMDPDSSLVARAIYERKTVHVEDMLETDRYNHGDSRFRHLVDEEGLRTNLFVPLISLGEGIGCFILFRKETRPYTNDQIALVETFAEQAVIAIENVRQFKALEQSNKELEARLDRAAATREILEVISQSRDDELPVFNTILENASRLCNAPLAYLAMANEERSQVTVPAHLGARPQFAEDLSHLSVPMSSRLALCRSITEQIVIRIDDIADDDLYRQREPNRVAMVENEGGRSILVAPLISGEIGLGSITLYRREVAPFSDDDVALVQTFAAQAVIAIENVRQYKALEELNAELGTRVDEQVGEIERMGRLKRFLSPAVADTLVNSGDESMLASHRALIATLFCDIRGFTAFCERAEPEETIEVLQTYHEEMGNLISEFGGGVDKRMGDGIMVIFNDPLPCDDPAGDAVRLAAAMRGRMADLCKVWKRHGHRLGFGVGISLGYATIGMVGSEGRYDYTASGTAVNLAARLCDHADDGEILLSPRAFTAVEDDFQAESSGELELKGIREPVEVFRLL